MPGTTPDLLASIGEIVPGLKPGGQDGRPQRGVMVAVPWALGPSLLVNTTIYKRTGWICPVDGAYLKAIYVACIVQIASGTHTLAVEKYDASASSGKNALSTTNISFSAAPPILKGFKLTLTTTLVDRVLDENDILWTTLNIGTQGTAGEGYAAIAHIVLPEAAI